jgi:hypothetical protein
MSTPSGLEPVYRFTVPPGVVSRLRVRSLPNAACTIRRSGDGGSSASLLVYSDPEGFIDVHVRPSNPHDELGRLVIEAVADGNTEQQMLELRAAAQPTNEMPLPVAPPPGPPAGAHVRPALSRDEGLRLSVSELIDGGYPLRPDPDRAPDAFDGWLRAVSVPAAQVEPHVVARPDVRHPGRAGVTGAAEPAPNWSGFELRGPPGTYTWVSAQWDVPSVTGENFTTTWSAFWIGLDGDGLTDLVQAGTEQNNTTFDFLFWNISTSTYYAWTEFLPQQQYEQQITNFTVSPGDQMFCEVWVGNAGSAPTLSGYFGVFLIENMTTSQYTWIYTPVGSTVVTGSEAEWIMERPTVNDAYPDLADYGTARMWNALALNTAGAYVFYQAAANEQITMFNGSDILSTVTPVNTSSMQFNWKAFH